MFVYFIVIVLIRCTFLSCVLFYICTVISCVLYIDSRLLASCVTVSSGSAVNSAAVLRAINYLFSQLTYLLYCNFVYYYHNY